MEKPKIVSMKDALELDDGNAGIPSLPSGLPSTDALDFQLPSESPIAPLTEPDISESKMPESELHPPEVPPERVALTEARPDSKSVASVPPSIQSVETNDASANSVANPLASVDSRTNEPIDSLPQTEIQAKPPAHAEVPPWVERNPTEPTVAEMAGPVGPVPTYPGVGRPRIHSISQGVVSLEPAKPLTAPIRPSGSNVPSESSVGSQRAPGHFTHHHVHTAHVKPAVHHREAHVASAPLNAAPGSSGKLYERPELDAEHFAHDLASHKPALTTSSFGAVVSPLSADASHPASQVVQEYRQVAAADVRPPAASARPRTPEEERAHAKSLAVQIHQDNQKAGLLGQLKRMFGLR